MKQTPAYLTLATAAICTAFLGAKCSSDTSEEPASLTAPESWTLEVKNSFPHDTSSFTQGLLFRNGVLYESVGRYEFSDFRRVTLNNGEVQAKLPLDDQYFAEGLAVWNNVFYQLTWKAGKAFAYTDEAGSLTRQPNLDFTYTGQGWGLTNDDRQLILSDGTDTIRFIDPDSKEVTKTIRVSYNDLAVKDINELEFINGLIWANVWQKNVLIAIDPDSGIVKRWVNVDTSKLFANTDGIEQTKTFGAVLNGIAYDKEGERLFITGKLWPKVFEVEIKAL